MSNEKIEIEENFDVYQSGENEGKPTGDITYKIKIDDKEKGEIHFSKKMQELSKNGETKLGAFNVRSKKILGEYKSKRFKTLTGAKNFIIRSKERFILLTELNINQFIF